LQAKRRSLLAEEKPRRCQPALFTLGHNSALLSEPEIRAQ
jgi:hypothetical protein